MQAMMTVENGLKIYYVRYIKSLYLDKSLNYSI